MWCSAHATASPDMTAEPTFEPICQGMMASPLARQHALLWGSLTGADASKEDPRGNSVANISTGECRAASSRRSN